MSMWPGTYISATFYTGVEDTSDIIDDIQKNQEDLQVACEDDGVVGTNYSVGYIVVYRYITAGWGDAADYNTFLDAAHKFMFQIIELCAERGFKKPSFLLGANYS